MVKKNKVCKEKQYSPYLSIYRPQINSVNSILERVSGLFMVLLLICIEILVEFADYFLMNYGFYYYYFNLVKGHCFFSNFFLIFGLLIGVYHVCFLPIVVLKLKNLVGNIIDYRQVVYKNIIKKKLSSSCIGVLLLSIVVYMSYLIVV